MEMTTADPAHVHRIANRTRTGSYTDPVTLNTVEVFVCGCPCGFERDVVAINGERVDASDWKAAR